MTDDQGNWAPPTDKLAGGGINVSGRRLTGPQQGFGPMWQKTFRVDIPGVTPEKVIAEWKANFDSFWPAHSRFSAPVAGILPGEIGNIKSMQVMSTGVLVIYADATSFSFMTPEGHPFAGWVTFSSYDEDGTVAQAQLIIRPSDPLWDVAFLLGAGRSEDRFWEHTVRSLAMHLGVEDPRPQSTIVKVDPKRLWRNAANVKNNAGIGSALSIFRPRSRRAS